MAACGFGQGYDRLIHQHVEIQQLRPNPGVTGIGEQLARELGTTMGGVRDLRQRLMSQVLLRDVEADQLGISQHCGEQIVEIVGNPTGEHAQALTLSIFFRLLILRRECCRSLLLLAFLEHQHRALNTRFGRPDWHDAAGDRGFGAITNEQDGSRHQLDGGATV